jgi:hypothetical protein
MSFTCVANEDSFLLHAEKVRISNFLDHRTQGIVSANL